MLLLFGAAVVLGVWCAVLPSAAAVRVALLALELAERVPQ